MRAGKGDGLESAGLLMTHSRTWVEHGQHRRCASRAAPWTHGLECGAAGLFLGQRSWARKAVPRNVVVVMASIGQGYPPWPGKCGFTETGGIGGNASPRAKRR
jgi:hypothetical protein